MRLRNLRLNQLPSHWEVVGDQLARFDLALDLIVSEDPQQPNSYVAKLERPHTREVLKCEEGFALWETALAAAEVMYAVWLTDQLARLHRLL